MSKIQDSFDSQAGDVSLEPGEYEGPLVITRPCTLDGRQSTLWAGSGPVLRIESPGVTVKNLRVEVTGENAAPEARVAIRTSVPDTVLSAVEVSGDVSGLSGEAPVWDVPTVLSLGTFAAGKVNSFSFLLHVPADARLSCPLKDIRITPDRLTRGDNRLFVETGEIKDRTIVYGELVVQTGVTRRIYITGKAEAGAPEHQAEPPLAGGTPVSEPLIVDVPQELIAPSQPDAQVPAFVKGQRIPAGAFQDQIIRVAYDCRGTSRPVEIDSYVFLLAENGKVRGDSDLIFFGNEAGANGEVRVTSNRGKPLVIVELEKVEPQVSKIVVSFSIYGDSPGENFSLVTAPAVRLLAGEQERGRFELAGLNLEKTVVALEFYRYKGDWKVQFVGAGYHSGLRTLCESYGVEVE